MVIDLDLPLRCQCKNDMPFDVGDCVQIWDFFHSALTHSLQLLLFCSTKVDSRFVKSQIETRFYTRMRLHW